MNKPMMKPKPRVVEYLDYFECEKFISHTLGYNIDDVLNNSSDCKRKEPFQCYWHFLIDATGLSNGSNIYLPSEDRGEPWQQEITKAFNAEFGQEAEYWVSW